MKRTFSVGVLTVFAVLSATTVATAAAEAVVSGSPVDYTKAIVVACSILAAALVMAQGNGLSSAANAVGRNPEAQGKILITMMVGLAMIESLAIYALVIALVVLYANPLLKVIGLS
jgi:F-type H+-transporting ATPase subunit c